MPPSKMPRPIVRSKGEGCGREPARCLVELFQRERADVSSRAAHDAAIAGRAGLIAQESDATIDDRPSRAVLIPQAHHLGADAFLDRLEVFVALRQGLQEVDVVRRGIPQLWLRTEGWRLPDRGRRSAG